MPDYAKAKNAVISMFALFAKKPKINNWSSEPTTKIDENRFNGSIKFDFVDFVYPQRETVPVLQKFKLDIDKGQRIALVGSSGCGRLE